MPCGSATDFSNTEQFRCDEFHRPPAPFFGKKVFGFRQQTSLQFVCPALAGPLHRQPANVLLIASGAIPGISPREASLGGDACQRDENLTFQPILRRPMCALAEFANTEMLAIRQNADPLHRPAQKQGHHRMAGFMICRGLIG